MKLQIKQPKSLYIMMCRNLLASATESDPTINSIATWKNIYHSLYVLGTKFADVGCGDNSDVPDLRPPVMPEVPLMELNLSALHQCYGERTLQGCVWGATYTSALFSYLTNLTWTTQENSATAWLELLVNFKMHTALATPVPLSPGLWQSPSILHG